MYFKCVRDPNMYTIPKDTPITRDVLNKAIQYNEKFYEKFTLLENYYKGYQEILNRIKVNSLKNNKIVVNHASYITDIAVGYLLGSPVDYVCEDYDIDVLMDAYKQQTISNLDHEIAKKVSIMGMQYEYIYASDDKVPVPKSAIIDNRSAMIVYDTTLQHDKLFGIIYRPIYNGEKLEKYEIIYVDKYEIIEYEMSGVLVEKDRNPHSFGEVPLIKYRNNEEQMGDFEKVISTIDSYNSMQSDRVNDKEQLVDAILCMYEFDFTPEQHDQLKASRVLAGIPKDGRIEYLTKTLQESDMDILMKSVEQNIHKISMVPNMSDENFAGNSSGVALEFKNKPFDILTKNKVRYFSDGLAERFVCYNNFLSTASRMPIIPISDVNITFTHSLPQNDLETSMIINNLAGKVKLETLLSQLSFVQNAKDVMEEEKEEEIEEEPKNEEVINREEVIEEDENTRIDERRDKVVER